jgi:hypothetical protein
VKERCHRCGLQRISLFRNGLWFCRRACHRAWLGDIELRIMLLADKIVGSLSRSSDAWAAVEIIDEFVTAKISSPATSGGNVAAGAQGKPTVRPG